MNTKEYNGWTNYETWLINLYFGDDTDWIHARVNDAHSVYDLAKMIEDWVKDEEVMPQLDGVYSDLLDGALSEVNWYELAKAWWEDYKKEDEDDNS